MKNNPRPIFNSKAVILISLLVIALTSFLVFFIGHKSVFVELQITLGIIALLLFLFLFVGLYFGIYFKEELFIDVQNINFKTRDLDESHLHWFTLFPFDIFEGFWGGIVSILTCIVLLIFLALAVDLLPAVFVFFFGMLELTFLNAFKQVFKKSRHCRGKFLISFLISLNHTFFYVFWIFALIWISKLFLHHS